MNTERVETTDDAILNGRLRLLQPKRGHRFGHDAILLAAATPARPGDRIAELGAGVGAASLALLARVTRLSVTLVEIDPSLTELAAENIVRNGFAENAHAVTLDAAAPIQVFEMAGLKGGSFDRVLMNPPFNDASLQASPDPMRRAAHMASDDTLRTWLQSAAYLLRQDGSVTLIWRADSQAQVLAEIAAMFGAVTILPVHPAPGQPPIRIVVTARTGADRSLRILAPLTLADHDRRPSIEAEAVLRNGMPLPSAEPTRSAAAADQTSTTDVRRR